MGTSAFESDAKRFALTASEVESLVSAAIQAKAGAYCRYSHFRVGAALLTSDGLILTGANVENASYPVTICAERCAMAKAVADGHTSYKAIAVSTDTKRASSPCGMCRQFIREFCDPSMPVFMLGAQDEEAGYDWKHGDLKLNKPTYLALTLGELLPESFGPDALQM